VKYHSRACLQLTPTPEAGGGTVPGGQFDWGGRLLKRNGGAQGFAQGGGTSPVACKSASKLDCKADRPRRAERRV